MDSTNNKQERNDVDSTVSRNDGSDNDDWNKSTSDKDNNSYYNATNPKLLKSISENKSLLSGLLTEPILSSLRERNIQREKLLKMFCDEYVKNDKGTLVFCESPGDPIKFYFENYDKTNDVNYKKRNEELHIERSLHVLMKDLRYYPNYYGDNDELMS